jgi:hypothetical protein
MGIRVFGDPDLAQKRAGQGYTAGRIVLVRVHGKLGHVLEVRVWFICHAELDDTENDHNDKSGRNDYGVSVVGTLEIFVVSHA